MKTEPIKLREDLIRFARKALGLSASVPVDFFPFEGRGSDRTFYRLKWNLNDSAILIHYDPTAYREHDTTPVLRISL